MTALPSADFSWRKSTHSEAASDCVELARPTGDSFYVRDSKAPEGGFLRFSSREWNAFLQEVKGRLD